jgi:hypothetical protein
VHTTYKVDLDRVNLAAPPILKTYYGRAVAIGGVGAVGTIIGFLLNSGQAFQSFLIGFMMCVGLTLGPLGFIFVWYLTGGRWGIPMRRIWEAATRNIYYCAALFIPILIGYRHLYPWARPEEVGKHEHWGYLAQHWLNLPLFLGRGVFYFACWIVLIYFVNKYSAIQDRPHDRYLGRTLTVLGSIGVVVYAFSMSFATFDWVMSLMPGWPSTIYGFIFLVGQGILGLALALIVGNVLVRYEPMNVFMNEVVFHDNGKLLLAFTMLWAYFSFSQWLIIWSGNLPEEIVFYLGRLRGGWQYASLFLVLFHFCVPFLMLLSASLKKNPTQVAAVAVWLVVMRWWDLYWNVEPMFSPEHFKFSWMDLVIPVGLVGIWSALFLRNLMARPLLPIYEPHLRQLVEAEHE